MSNYKHTVYLKNPLEDLATCAIGGKKKISIVVGNTIYIDAIYTFDSVILSFKEEDYPKRMPFVIGQTVLFYGHLPAGSLRVGMECKIWQIDHDRDLVLINNENGSRFWVHYKQCERVEG